ncbi:MAG: MoaD/ThiS family protein [Syntrophobacteraceae bacterium]
MVKVFFRESEFEAPGNVTIRELIKGLGLNPLSVLAVQEGKLVSNETRLKDEGEIKLISVISGG